ncbi:MAG: Mov34/MPN/PAD-1 family protein [archaeon GB-1867-035]|nr:Mov34/MPN/PAD-1 family protein [Candidatus Culexmicrobium profundum]
MVEVLINRDCLETILMIAKNAYPKETLLLLRGKIGRGLVKIEEILFLPPRYVGFDAVSFDPYRLPIDFSIVGIVHSHPSGDLKPSLEDLNADFGSIMMIVGYPFDSKRDVAVYDYDGRRLKLRVID